MRVLPGHLLRRCRVLSSIQLGDKCQQRVALTACTGEELTTTWVLSRSNDTWEVESISRDTFSDSELPTKPHPRSSPELVILGQLAALQRGDVRGAACLMLQNDAENFKSMLRQECFHRLLLQSSQPLLCSAAVPAQNRFLQEVILETSSSVLEQTQCHFIWHMHLDSNQCWRVASIEPVPQQP